jgi:phage shock protein PspC (stress-responsive transcriptional regulator)
MRKVTTVNLNHNAFQIDDDGYESLRAYLDAAERALASNPDKAEILADLEQAIADRCTQVLGSHKTVVSKDEIDHILHEMGPVESGTASTASGHQAPNSEPTGSTADSTANSNTSARPAEEPRKLYRIKQGAMLAGVCNGLAAYTGVDVVWIRLAFALATFIGFSGLIIYVILALVVPLGNVEPPLPGPRRLYRLKDDAMVAGVCSGLGAFLGVDVALVRLAFVLTVLLAGSGIVLYLVMALIVPRADTDEEKAAASGLFANAQDVIDRVKKKSEEFRREYGNRAQARHARRARHAFRSSKWSSTQAMPPPGYAARITGGVLLPVLTALSACWFAVMAIVFMAVWWAYDHGWSHFGNGLHHWPHDVPRWAALVAIVALYLLIALPIGAARRASLYYTNGGRLHGWADAWSGLLWIVLVAAIVWVAWHLTGWLPMLLQQLLHEAAPVVTALLI